MSNPIQPILAKKITSKILVCETDKDAEAALQHFAEKHDLVPIRIPNIAALPRVLSSHIDLGGIFLSETYGSKDQSIEIARRIRRLRRELPIFYRTEEPDSDKQERHKITKEFAGSYTLKQMDHLKTLVDKYIFNTWYPDTFIRRIQDISVTILENQFLNCTAEASLPYLVKDNIIYGKLMTMIPIESDWCRGFMVLEAEKSEIREAIQAGNTYINPINFDDDFRIISSHISEVTNLIWGGLKNEFFARPSNDMTLSQIPIVINHHHDSSGNGSNNEGGHISFGTGMPQLCFKYIIKPSDENLCEIIIFEKFIFNLKWSPDQFNEELQAENQLMETGEIELF